MLSDGELARLTKEDFIELIRTPVLRGESLQESRERVNSGALWLDVRFPEEHTADGLTDSLNIPLSSLRASHGELNKDLPYVVYCDTGGRSSAAAFLLTQEGFEVSYVVGGAIDEVATNKIADSQSIPEQARVEPAPLKKTQQLGQFASPKQDEIVEADIRAQSLAAGLEKANFQIEQAKRVVAQAEAAKRDADRVVAEKLQKERSKIDRESAARQAELVEAQRLKDEVAARLREERADIDRESAATHAKLVEAQRLKGEIERQQVLAAEIARKRHQEQEDRTAALEREANARLQEDEKRIEELYRKQAEGLDSLAQQREKSESDIKQAWEEIEIESTISKERLEAAKELEAELMRMEKESALELEAKEREMRATLQAELDVERRKLEAEFARTAEEIDRAKREQAEAAKIAAAAKAKQIIEEYKQSQEALQAEQAEKLLAGRRQIEIDAARLKTQLEQAAETRQDAESIKREAERQLAQTRHRRDVTEASLHEEIAAIEERARAATERLRSAVAQENSAEYEHLESELRLERTYGTKNEINLLLQKELDEWVEEQERVQESTSWREEIEKQVSQTERIKHRAVQAQRDNTRHDSDLLDEIAVQLSGDP